MKFASQTVFEDPKGRHISEYVEENELQSVEELHMAAADVICDLKKTFPTLTNILIISRQIKPSIPIVTPEINGLQ